MKLKVGMISLGCNKNRVDSEIALGLLRDKGYTFTGDPAQADVLMVNTCGFIEPAKEESIDAILEMAEYKKTGRCNAAAGPKDSVWSDGEDYTSYIFSMRCSFS